MYYNNPAVDRQMFKYIKSKPSKVKKRRKIKKENNQGFFDIMKPNIKLAFIFFFLAKISCFTIAPGFIVLSRLDIIPNSMAWIGIAIYGLFIFSSIYFGLKEVFIGD